MEIEEINYKDFTIQTYIDTDAENPAEWGNFEIVQFRDNDFNTYTDFEEYTTENGKLLPSVQAKLRAGKMFTIDYRRYSNTDGGYYHLDGAIPTGEVDTQDVNGFIIFSDGYIKGTTYEERRNYAEGDLATYTGWANGQVYGYDITDQHDNEIESCWGFYGYDNMIKECEAIIDAQLELPLSQQPKHTAAFAGKLHN